MKGQYLAVEYIFVTGLSLILVLGSVTIFNLYREEVMETSVSGQTDIVASKMTVQMNNLDQVESGTVEKSVSLPEEMGNREYELSLAPPNDLVIDVQGDEYTYELRSLNEYDFTGSAEGGQITLYKNDDQYSITG